MRLIRPDEAVPIHVHPIPTSLGYILYMVDVSRTNRKKASEDAQQLMGAVGMKLSGAYTFNADQQTVWNLLTNPDAIAKALPGVEKLVPIEGESDAWRATAKIGIGPVSGSYTGVIRMTDIQAGATYKLNVSGEGQQSVISGSATITLASGPGDDATKTVLNWTGDATISGKLAGIGQRLIQMAAGTMANQFFHGLAKQLPASA